MSYQIETYPAYDLIGIEARLDSGSDFSTIQALWNKFMEQNTLQHISNKFGDDFIALYTNYEADYSAGMNLVIGAKVSATDAIPKGMVHKHVTAQTFAHFVAKGQMPDCILNEWKKIWSADIDWAYTDTFELYSERSLNPEDAEVDIYIALK